MTTKDSQSLIRQGPLRWTLVTVMLAFAFVQPVNAENYLAEFEGPEVSWKVALPPRDSRVAIHERRRGIGKSGGAEFMRVYATRENSSIRLEHSLPPATVLDELEISIWFKSTHEGFGIELKLVLPEIIDPQTNAPFLISITGDRYKTPNQWQQLTCRTSDRAVSDQLRLLRARRQMSINPKVMYVDKVLLSKRSASSGHNGPANRQSRHCAAGPIPNRERRRD